MHLYNPDFHTDNINESLKSARKKYQYLIGLDEIEDISMMDPTKSYKYTEKMCELFNLSIDKKTIKELIQNYEKYQRFMEIPDITHKTYNEIVADIKVAKYASENSISRIKEKEKERNRIFYNDTVSIYKIKNFYDARIKGTGTHWCISLSEEWFMIHKLNGQDFLFIYYNNLNPQSENYRLALTIDKTSGRCYITNKNNVMHEIGSKEEKDALNLMGKDALNFLTNYISTNYDK
mgnify:CR=1 FL=1